MEPSIFNTLKRYVRKSGCVGRRKCITDPEMTCKVRGT